MARPHSGVRSGTSGDIWETSARAGFAVSGMVHLILGYLIASVALGSGAEADQTTALSRVAGAPVGGVLLWIAAAALLALALWQFADALRGHDATERLRAAGRGILYAALAVTAASVTLGSSDGSSDEQAQGVAGQLMQVPGGRAIVGALALGIVAGGAYHVVKGARRSFLDDLEPAAQARHRTWISTAGIAGYGAKGVALGAVGALFGYAAVTADPEQAQGIDGAVESLVGLPGGAAVVVLIGAGFAAYGIYSFARARFAAM